MIKRLIVFILILSNAIILSGCWGYSEIDQYSIVAGFAVDEGENGYKFRITFELINIKASGGSSTELESKLIEVDANTVFGGIRDMVGIASKKLSFPHCKLIVIDKQIAENGISDILDSVVRDYEGRITMNVVISKEKTAKEILESKSVSNPIISYELVSTLNQNPKYLCEAPSREVYQIYNEINSPGIDTILPCFGMVKKGENATYELCGTAVLKKDKVVGYLDSFESKALLFVIDEIDGGLIGVTIDKEKNSHAIMEIYNNKSSIKPYIKNNELIFEIKANSVVTLDNLEVGTQEIKYSLEFEKKIKNLVEKSLEKRMKDVISKVQNETDSDIFGFGSVLSKDEPKLWKKYESTWNKTFKTVKFNVDVNIHIRGTGITKSSIIKEMEKSK